MRGQQPLTGHDDGAEDHVDGSGFPAPWLAFGADVKRFREFVGCTQSVLAVRAGYDASYVSKIEGGRTRPTPMFARRIDEVLQAGGAILHSWQVCREAMAVATTAGRPAPVSTDARPGAGGPGGPAVPPTGSIRVLSDDATLFYDCGSYRLTQRRHIENVGLEPINGYLARIHVDRYPDDPERSRLLYRRHPLRWAELGFRCWYGTDRAIELACDPGQTVTDSLIEAWVLFTSRGDSEAFPLYPNHRMWFEYEYAVGDDKWGRWFQRHVRLPTDSLSVRINLPSALAPQAWGREKTNRHPREYGPIRSGWFRTERDGRTIFSWSTANPRLGDRFRMEWRFGNQRDDQEAQKSVGEGVLAERGGADLVDRPIRTDPSARPSEIMTAIHIVQYGDPILTTPTTPLDLPREADLARDIVRELRSRADEVQRAHEFKTGMGLAAPQIGIARSVAIFRPNDGPETVLINPRVVFADPPEDEWAEDSEGCLSFFDVRYLVRRPRFIVVVHQAPDGARRSSTFERGRHARDVLHEVDHLSGRLCRDVGREAAVP